MALLIVANLVLSVRGFSTRQPYSATRTCRKMTVDITFEVAFRCRISFDVCLWYASRQVQELKSHRVVTASPFELAAYDEVPDNPGQVGRLNPALTSDVSL
jgi:hypothetical protein